MKQCESDLKILILQIRQDEYTLNEEFNEFITFSGLNKNQFTSLDAFKYKDFPSSIINGYDALFIGGSSDASVLDPNTYNFIPNCKALLRTCYEQNIPTLASCFGFQLAVDEFGGQVELDEKNKEIGLFQIELHNEIKHDPLLHDCPNNFWAVSGHKERATVLPEDAITLASTPLCPYHIFSFKNKPFYAFQFHPEVCTQDLISRITRYKSRYLDNDASLQTIINNACHLTTHSNLLIKKFVDRIILN